MTPATAVLLRAFPVLVVRSARGNRANLQLVGVDEPVCWWDADVGGGGGGSGGGGAGGLAC